MPFPFRPASFLALALLLGDGGSPASFGVASAWAPKEVTSTRDLQENMYPAAGHAPCVLLLNETGAVGCSSA